VAFLLDLRAALPDAEIDINGFAARRGLTGAYAARLAAMVEVRRTG
jgi:hypothetical protein